MTLISRSFLLNILFQKISKNTYLIHIICFEMHMDRPDKSDNIFGIKYKLSKHLTFYVSSLIFH